MRQQAVVALALAALAGCGGSSERVASAPTDVHVLAAAVERYHPDPWHDVAEEDFAAAAAALEERLPDLSADQRLVELMRLTALLGERDGHSGIFPLDPGHRRELGLYPLRLYDFADGLHIVDAIGRRALVGAEVEAIAGVPVDKLRALVEPLVPRDNASSLAARVPQFMVVAEVLHGLGVTPAAGPIELDLAGGGSVTLEPVPASAYAQAFPDLFHPMVPPGLPERPQPPALARRLEERWLARLDGGRVVYAAYNVTLGSTVDFAADLRRAARRPGVERVVLDLRHNPGGDNTTYGPLLEELVAVDDLVVLVGRTTFSAAANLIAELEQRADPTLIGEPTGGSPNLYGDPVEVSLPDSGLIAQVAGVSWELAGPDDTRLAFAPDVPVEPSIADFLAGRDAALTAALRPAPR